MNLHTVISLRITPELKQRIDAIKKKLGLSQPQIMEKGVEYYEQQVKKEGKDEKCLDKKRQGSYRVRYCG